MGLHSISSIPLWVEHGSHSPRPVDAHMALISCAECGAEISDRAPACPRCGCPASFQGVALERHAGDASAQVPVALATVPDAPAKGQSSEPWMCERCTHWQYRPREDGCEDCVPTATSYRPGLQSCRECRAPVASGSDACPSCGAKNPALSPDVHGVVSTITGVLSLLAIYYLFRLGCTLDSLSNTLRF